jgi:hypothetical protein
MNLLEAIQMEKSSGCINEGKVMFLHETIEKQNSCIKWKAIHLYLYNDRLVYHDEKIENIDNTNTVLLLKMDQVKEIFSTDVYIFQVKLISSEEQVLSFQVASEFEKNEWIGCLQLAQTIQNRMITNCAHKSSVQSTTIDHIKEKEGKVLHQIYSSSRTVCEIYDIIWCYAL